MQLKSFMSMSMLGFVAASFMCTLSVYADDVIANNQSMNNTAQQPFNAPRQPADNNANYASSAVPPVASYGSANPNLAQDAAAQAPDGPIAMNNNEQPSNGAAPTHNLNPNQAISEPESAPMLAMNNAPNPTTTTPSQATTLSGAPAEVNQGNSQPDMPDNNTWNNQQAAPMPSDSGATNDGAVAPYPPAGNNPGSNELPPDNNVSTNPPADAATPDTATGDDDY